jgi:Undecaprenyl-phosphate glucose phosphotransferase
MLKRYQRTIGNLFRVFDAAIVVGAWLLAYWERFYGIALAPASSLPEFSTYAALSPLVAVLWIATFSSMRVYESRRMTGRLDEMKLVLRAHGTALLFFIAITYAFDDYKYSRGVMAYFAAIGAIGLAGSRFSLRGLLRKIRARGYNLRNVLVVGEGAMLQHLVTRIGKYPELGLRVIGVLTPAESSEEWVAGAEVLGHFEDLARVVDERTVDEVTIALGQQAAASVDAMLESLKGEPVDLRLVPDVHRYVTLGCDVEEFDGMPVVRLNDSPLMGAAALFKRSTDLLLSALALLILATPMAIIAIAVKLSSRGPILYGQERMGLDGRTFIMYKFRSMKVDAEVSSGAVWATKNDDRRTAVGTFLRKTSLDELPQFWNVFRGDMSLVGPRPERPVFVSQFKHEIPGYMLRHKVKSGITGWAQVNGWRGDTSLARRIECDLFYIKHWSYFLDLRILVMTLWKGFVHKNAY